MSFSEFRKIQAEAPVDLNCTGGDCEELRTEFRYVVYVGKQIYAYWDEKRSETGTDFDALASRLEKSITDSTTQTQYYRALRRWAAAFHDGHVNAMAKEGWTDGEIYSSAVRLELLAPGTDREKLIVARVDNSLVSGIAPGDAVLSVNGVASARAIDAAEVEASGSTAPMRRRTAAIRIVDTLGVEQSANPLGLEIQRGDSVKFVEIPRTIPLTEKMPEEGSSATPSAPDPTGIDLIQARILPGGLGYLRIDGFQGTQDAFLLDQAMDRLAGTRGLLIDLRKNGGGDQSANVILARLAKPATSIVRYQVSESLNDYVIANRPEYFFKRGSAGELFAAWSDKNVKAAEGKHYDRPVVALTSANCFSACDTFVSALKVNQLATIAGEATGGGTGTPLVFELPVSGHRFRYSVVRGRTAKGAPLEGVGTAPDVLIEPTAEERASARDLQLTRALAVLQDRVNSIPNSGPIPLRADPALARAVNALASSWNQDLAIPPTIAEERALRRIFAIDEL